jgi:sec-independent protein translocase protein TatA
MGSFSIWHWLIVLVVVLVLFGGRGKLSQLMGDMAKGITAFKKGLKDENTVEENAVEQDDETKVIKSESSSASSETVKKDETA